MKRTIAAVLVAIMTILCIGGGYSESDALNDGIEAEEIILDQLPEPEQESEEDMATGDKLVNLDDLKVAYDKQQEDTNALKNALMNDMRYIVGIPDLLSENGWNVGAYISQTGVITPYQNAQYTNLIPVNGEPLEYYYKTSASSSTMRIHGYDSNGDWDAQITTETTGTTIKEKHFTIKTEGYSYIRISESTDITPLALVETNKITDRIIDVKNALDSVTEYGNMFNKLSATTGYRLSDNGDLYSGWQYFTSDYIPVEAGKTYYKNSPSEGYEHAYCLYNSSKVFQSYGTANKINVDVDGYVRFCGITSSEINTAKLKYFDFTAIDLIAREMTGTNTKYNYRYLVGFDTLKSGEVINFPFNFSKGDTIRCVYSVTSYGSGHALTIKLGTHTFVNVSASSQTGQNELTLTSDEESIDVYSTSGVVSLLFYKKETLGEMSENVTVAVGEYYYKNILNLSHMKDWGSIRSYPFAMNSEDIIKAVCKCTAAKTLILYTNTNDFWINTTNTSATNEREIMLTSNATGLRIQGNCFPLDIALYKKIKITDDSISIVQKLTDIQQSVSDNEYNAEYFRKTFGNLAVVGEANLRNNAELLPDQFIKAFELDCRYKYFSVANIKAIIDKMHDVSLNFLELNIVYGVGISFKLNDMTFSTRWRTFNIADKIATDYGDYYDETDMEEIIEYANSKGVEIVPSVNVMSHMTALLSGITEYSYTGAATSSLNIDSEEAQEYGIGILRMYADWFATHGCRYFNMCCDEFMNRDTISTLQAQGNFNYADYMNRLAFILSTYGFKVWAWNDCICANDSVWPLINRRITVNFWQRYLPYYGSVATIAGAGYKLINSSEQIYWTITDAEPVTAEEIRQFNIHTFGDSETYQDIAGVKFCTWIGNQENPSLDDGGDNLTSIFLPLIQAFGETVNSQLS